MIHFSCALACEAEALINNYKLVEAKQFDLFRIYQSEDEQYSLVISGIGKLNAAAAVGYHHACLDTSPSDAWLNIGVAGHAGLDIGQACLCNKITDKTSGTSWYPQIVFDTSCKHVPLLTLDSPSNDYEDALFDMEAAGFYAIAIRLGTAELIHSLKFISDNRTRSDLKPDKNRVRDIITANINHIDQVVDNLVTLCGEMQTISATPPGYDELIHEYHFTQTEQLQLAQLLRQWSVRFPETPVTEKTSSLDSGKAILRHLQEGLNDPVFSIHD